MHAISNRLTSIALLSLAVTAAAQTPAPISTPALEATTAPTTQISSQSSTQPSTQTADNTPPSPSSHISFNFKDAPIDSILDYLSENLGFIIIKDGHIDGRVTITSKQPVTPDEAVDLLNSVLKPVNYTVSQTGRVLRVLSRDKAKKADIPVHVGNDPDKIRNSDELITQVIPLGQVDAVKLKADLTSMFSPDADVSANAASNTLVITDTSANIHHLVLIISAMDKHLSTSTDIKVFKLKYANAAAAAKLINDIFKPDTSSTQANNAGGRGFGGFGGGGGGFGGFGGGGGGFGGGGRGGAGGAAAPAADPNATRTTKITASSDDRTNTVVVTGSPDTLSVVGDILTKLDSDPSQDTVFFIYHLKNANAANLQSVLNSFFGNSASGSVTSNNRSSTGFAAIGSTSTGSSSLGGSTLGGNTNRNNTSNNSTINTASSNNSRNTGTTTNAPLTTATSDLQNQAFIVADNDTNSLLVTATSKYADRVRAMLVELDRDVPQVLIKVLIAQVTHDDSSDIGVEYSILNTRPSGNGQSGGQDFGLAQAITNATATGTPNGLVARVIESNISATLKALATAGKLDVLSRPSILGVDNQLASIMVGQSVPFVTASNQTTNGNLINTVQYQDIGIILNVTPHINPDGLVILDVAPEISDISSQTVTIQAGVSVPVFDKRSAQSRVAIRNNQTIVIGGLIQDQNTQTINKIPLLGDIPYLGQFFSRHINSKSKSELLIFITPQVAGSPDMLPSMSDEERNSTKILPSAIDPATFKDYMNRMHRPGTAPTTLPAPASPELVNPTIPQP